MTTTTARPAEIEALRQMYAILDEARGDHTALANVRRETALRIDAHLAHLASFGVDTDAPLDSIGR